MPSMPSMSIIALGKFVRPSAPQGKSVLPTALRAKPELKETSGNVVATAGVDTECVFFPNGRLRMLAGLASAWTFSLEGRKSPQRCDASIIYQIIRKCLLSGFEIGLRSGV